MSSVSHRLCLLRHAQAALVPGLPDHDRPLTESGETAALRVGDWLAEAQLLPDIAIVSTARRTRATWDGVQKRLSAFVPAVFEKRIYESTPENILESIQYTAEAHHCVLVVGHNPGLHQLALDLIEQGDSNSLARLNQEFTPGSLVIIDFPALPAWEQLDRHSGVLQRFVTP
ncbi:histidine phosphatase family protein [Pusillimonas sp. CC-YST705]|uniref:Histidine phosphatase family protein n=1 Tax=Mesopusillimonas faecipullorum TaxID=2755040 RepID=A0ABS8CAU7_9BURK|nr:histidine phosphatase family protein [Mesopusillimonas faecipullorum]MCB5362974.1 histidine phosphatase family protein [Mesopusillimonas faecipullorum]